jgi:hypothetical protein
MPTDSEAFAKSIRHDRVLLSGIHAFKDLQAGFPANSASGMTICETVDSF